MKRIVMITALLWAGVASADVYQDAVNDPGRPGSDREDDDRRKPAEVMAFAGVRPGMVVIEIGAGRGYTTELASRIVGQDGAVYAHRLDPARVLGNRLPNVVVLPMQPDDPGENFEAAGITRGSVDRILAFFSLHDGYLAENFDTALWYGTFLDFLKPGGEIVVLDNTAAAGSGLTHTADLHRIDPEILKGDLDAAGFEFVSESDILRNPEDDLMSSWFEDTATRKAGYQDRFALRYRKP